MPDTAAEVARRYGLDPKRYRGALRAEGFSWHVKHSYWNPPDGSPEHRDMIRMAGRLAADASEPE